METRRTYRICTLLCGLILLVAQLAWAAPPDAGFGADSQTPSLGSGKIKVRLYADFFCAPCRAMEPKVEPIIADLVKRNVITITFIDAPFHQHSSLYTRYFLFIYREKKDVDHILRARNVLFGASRDNVKEGLQPVTDPQKLEEQLTKSGIRFRPFDVAPVFHVLEEYLKEDKIMETPTCVIINGGKREAYKGGADIIKALTSLK